MILLSLAASLALAGRASDGGGATEWNQSRGNPDGSAAIDVEPIRSDPEEAWRASVKHLVSEPVCSNGMVYVVGAQGSSRKLYALDARTGEFAATPTILSGPAGDEVFLAAWQGFVAVVEHDAITLFQHHGHQLASTKERRFPGRWPSPPSVRAGFLFACDAAGALHVYDLRQGRSVGSVSGGFGRPSAIAGEKPGEIVIACVSYAADVLAIARSRLRGIETAKPELTPMSEIWTGTFDDATDLAPALAHAYIARMAGTEPDSEGTWFAYTPRGVKAAHGPALHALILPNALAPITSEAAIFRHIACGFSDAGALVAFHSSGKHGFVLPEDKPLPAGARRGRATIARDVLYLENWAIEIESGRVLWCKPDLDPVTPLIPIADGRALYGTKNGDLVCLRDPGAAKGAAASTAIAPSRPSAPGTGDGVVTADGRRIDGKVTELGGGRLRVEAKKSGPVELGVGEVALVESGGTARLLGEAYAIYRAFSAALEVDVLEAIDHAFDGYLRAGFLDDSRRLLAETRVHDVDGRTTTGMEKRLSGVSTTKSGNAAAQLERLKKEEAKMRETLSDSFFRAAAWSRDHGASLAASALLLDSDRLMPGRKEVQDAAAALVPPGFSPTSRAQGPMAWLRLAKEILPASGEILGPDDASWKLVRPAAWSTQALAMRTKNLNFFSTESDPAVVGSCLRHGENAVRVLSHLFGASTGASTLAVIVHKDRAEYLSASTEDGHPGQEWTAGFYSPLENLSRFFVPRAGKDADLLERDLGHVLAHELCHHYIAQRWLGGREHGAQGDPGLPGFWIVEGMADFVADQTDEMDRRGERFDDETVLSIDASARLLEAGKLMPVGELLELSHLGFAKLEKTPTEKIQPRHKIGSFGVSATNVFYAESASLVFYLVNRGGAERRQAVIESLRDWYSSRTGKEGWKKLGFERVQDLEAGYLSFLREAAH